MIGFLSFFIVWLLSGFFYDRMVVIPLRRRADTAEKAYAELNAQSAIRERDLIAERDHVSDAGGRIMNQLVESLHNSDRLAVTVRQYAKDIRETMVLLNDETAPKELVAAEEALRLHDSQVQLRNKP